VVDSALKREAKVARALREIGTALAPTEELDDVLELLLARTQELLESERATLYILDESTGELVSRLLVGGEVRSIRMRVGFGIAGIVAQTGKTIRLRDAYSDPRFEPQWDLLTGFITRSLLATPLRDHLGSTIGVLQVLNKKNNQEFSDDDEALLIALSTQAAVVIAHSRLVLRLSENNRQLWETHQRLQQRVRELQLLFDLERSTARATSLQELACAALSQITATCDVMGAALLVSDEESGDLILFELDSTKEGNPVSSAAKSGDGWLGKTMLEGTARVLDRTDLAALPLEAHFDFPVTNGIVAPLEGVDTHLGAAGLFGPKKNREFNQEDLELLRLLSSNISTAVRLHRAATARELTERLTAIGRLLSQVVHDFKTPMTVISGYAQLMVDSEDRAQRAAYAEEILRQFELVTSMQREVLEFARGERSIFVRRVYLARFFHDLVRQIEREIAGLPIELETHVDSKATARFDEARLSRAVHNLVRNAIEAMQDKGGRLTIRATAAPGSVSIEVSDTGPGIPPAIAGRIFQSFVTANKPGGTGLGLAIVKKIVDEHGGTVHVDSSPDTGATFRITLPQTSDALVGSGTPPRNPAPAGEPPPAAPPPSPTTH
jgi:signal transduction histidine kinase/putative methionine-R-sulfoxide reductase with GAF domain